MMLHIADLHIGASLNGFDMLEDQKYTLNHIRSIIEENNIKYLLLSGDIYDKYNPSNEAVRVFEEFLISVSKLNVRVIVISGNHDSKARLSYLANFLKSYSIYIFTSLADLEAPLEFEDDKLSFLPLPYLNKKELELYYNDHESSNLALHQNVIDDYFNKANKDYKHIALAHNLVIGGSISDSERTLSVGGLDDLDRGLFANFDYAALGHLHLYQHLGKGIYYTGSICKYSISEFNNKNSANIYDYKENKVTRVCLNQLHNTRILEGYFKDILEIAKVDSSSSDYIHINLLDDTVIYDAYNRLNSYYQFLVSISYKTKNNNTSNNKIMKFNHKEVDELSLFESLYSFQLQKEMSTDAKEYLQNIINELKEENL